MSEKTQSGRKQMEEKKVQKDSSEQMSDGEKRVSRGETQSNEPTIEKNNSRSQPRAEVQNPLMHESF